MFKESKCEYDYNHFVAYIQDYYKQCEDYLQSSDNYLYEVKKEIMLCGMNYFNKQKKAFNTINKKCSFIKF